MSRLLFLPALLLVAAPAFSQPVTQPFTFSLIRSDLPAIQSGSVTWADVDRDGDLDALVSGFSDDGPVSAVYRNDGKAAAGSDSLVVFTEHATLPALSDSRSAWADIDSDGDLDLAMTGFFGGAPYFGLYRNDAGGLSEINTDGIAAVYAGALAFGDADANGAVDLVLSGLDADGIYRTILALNDGTGTFSDAPHDIPGIAFGEARWADYDGDGRQDLVIGGASADGFVTNVYRNTPGGLVDAQASLPGVVFSSVDWGDMDADGDLDILLGGGRISSRILDGTAHVYTNDGGSFRQADSGITGTLAGRTTFGDYDNDGDLDVLALGAQSALGRRTATLFRNDSGTFSEATFLIGGVFASADWGDFDGDGDLDLLVSGLTSSGFRTTNVYENRRQVKPPPPAAPTSLTARVEGQSVALSWAVEPAFGHTFDIRIGTAPGIEDVVSSPAHPESGRRYLGVPGRWMSTGASVTDLAPGVYFWSVQAVDASFGASTFSAPQSFEIAGVSTSTGTMSELPTAFETSPVYPNPFRHSATVTVALPEVSNVSVRLFDVVGRLVRDVYAGVRTPGNHEILVSTPDLSPGTYFVEVRAGDHRSVRTAIRVR